MELLKDCTHDTPDACQQHLGTARAYPVDALATELGLQSDQFATGDTIANILGFRATPQTLANRVYDGSQLLAQHPGIAGAGAVLAPHVLQGLGDIYAGGDAFVSYLQTGRWIGTNPFTGNQYMGVKARTMFLNAGGQTALLVLTDGGAAAGDAMLDAASAKSLRIAAKRTLPASSRAGLRETGSEITAVVGKGGRIRITNGGEAIDTGVLSEANGAADGTLAITGRTSSMNALDTKFSYSDSTSEAGVGINWLPRGVPTTNGPSSLSTVWLDPLGATHEYPFINGFSPERIVAMGKGNRPDALIYLDPSYHGAHLASFQRDGAAFLFTESDVLNPQYAAFNPMKFVMNGADMNKILNEYVRTGDLRAVKDALGYKPGSLEGEKIYVWRIEHPDVRMPSGNEGVNKWWRPAGYTHPGGNREAVLNRVRLPHNNDISNLLKNPNAKQVH